MIKKRNYNWINTFSLLDIIIAEIGIFLNIKINKLAFANILIIIYSYCIELNVAMAEVFTILQYSFSQN